jgi:RimJ/RimL family protein N-acetyltransferase
VKTRQLLLRAPVPEDVDALFRIQRDPDAMRHTWVATDRRATARRLEAYAERFAEDGYAPWTAVLRRDDRVVGWGGLNRDPQAPQWGTEVAYFIDPSQWGRGLATELVGASLRLAFREIGLTQVCAFTKTENHASRRVLEKAGFRFARRVPELERDEYRVDSTRWEASVSTHFPERIRGLPPFEGPFDAFRLAAEGCQVLFASYPAGTVIEPHTHATENCGVVTQGELLLTVDGVETRYLPGDWYHLSAGQTHSARFEVATSEIEFWFGP